MPEAGSYQSGSAAEIEVGFTAARSARLVFARMGGAALTALTASYWLGFTLPALWLLSLFLFERLAAPALASLTRTDAKTSARDAAMRPWFILAGSLLYLTPCAITWLKAGAAFDSIGAFYLACMLVHGSMYRSATPIFAACSLGPPSLAAFVLPWLAGANLTIAILSALGGLQLAAVVVMSLGERRRLIDSALIYKTEAIDADRANKAKSQFLAVMTHELRTPLNAIIGYAEILQEDINDNVPPRPEDAGRIAQSGRTLLALINDVLDLSKIEAGRVELNIAPVLIGDLTHGAVETCRGAASRNGNIITTQISPEAGIIYTDPLRLRQCLLNLLSNASKFTKNGKINVTVDVVRWKDADAIRLQVTDSGIGISSEQMAKLFQPFVQADASITRAYGGTGLGLSITRKICELLDGEVTLQSKLGAGTTCAIVVPATREPASALVA